MILMLTALLSTSSQKAAITSKVMRFNKGKSITRGSDSGSSATQRLTPLPHGPYLPRPILAADHDAPSGIWPSHVTDAGGLVTLPDRTHFGFHRMISTLFLIHRSLTDPLQAQRSDFNLINGPPWTETSNSIWRRFSLIVG